MGYINKIKYRHLYFFVFILLILTGFQFCSDVSVPYNKEVTVKKLDAVAGNVLRNAVFKFVDENTGIEYDSARSAPADAMLKIVSPYNDWRYWNGILNISMLKLAGVLKNPAYSHFALKNIAFAFNNYKYFKERYKGEDKWSYPFGQRFIMADLDDYGAMGASLIEVYEIHKNPSYKKYIDEAAHHIMTRQQRYADGSYIRSFPEKMTLWADDLYMSISFLCRMGKLSGNSEYFDDAAKQIINYNKHLFDTAKCLMYHNWYSDRNKHGAAFWGRANGWALLAQIDLLERLPGNYAYSDTLLSLFKRHIGGILRYQSSGGLWHQLLDKKDSYLETSCSAMFTYVIAKAVNSGILNRGYSSAARLGWQGILSRIRPDGKIEGVCTGTVVSDDLSYYYNRPTPLNDVHGLGPVLLAGAEVYSLK